MRVLAMSSFTAGALFGISPATVLPSGMSQEWFDTLVRAAEAPRDDTAGFQIATAFRLTAWREKGLPELIAAIASLGRADVRLSVCGTGQPPSELLKTAREFEWCTLLPELNDAELARQLAAADLFVLATRTRTGRRPCGEGFGLALLEAQVAGTPVVGPAYGGAPDAYIDRVTGVAPIDETPDALARVLLSLLQDRQGLIEMGNRSARWAREFFAPTKYADLVAFKYL